MFLQLTKRDNTPTFINMNVVLRFDAHEEGGSMVTTSIPAAVGLRTFRLKETPEEIMAKLEQRVRTRWIRPKV